MESVYEALGWVGGHVTVYGPIFVGAATAVCGAVWVLRMGWRNAQLSRRPAAGRTTA